MITTTCFYFDNYIILLSIYVCLTMKKISILLMLLTLLTIEVIGTSKKSGNFVHPGLLHTTADLQRMKSMVATERQPWYAALQSFAADLHSSLSYSIQGPDAIVTRDAHGKTNVATSHLTHDSTAALQLALMYSITGNSSYAALATKILEEWTDTLIIINGMLIIL